MLKIANGTLVLPTGRRRADLYIQDGRVAAIGGDHPVEETLDASDCLVFPGLIDAHTHLEMDTGATWTADGYASGTLAALCGGTTTVLDFATQDRGGTLAAALEAWGGATFDASLRFLNEDPWERLRKIKAKAKKTPLQMLLRGQNILGYKHYADDVVDYFVQKAVANGMDIIRIFDALNDPRNIERA